MREWIEKFRRAGLLKEISAEVSSELEAAHISYIEAKKEDSKALLFTNIKGKKFPLLTNLFASHEALRLILGGEPDEFARKIERFLKPKKPENFADKFDFFRQLTSLRHIFPKRLKGTGQSQEVRDVKLSDIPFLKTWEHDGGAFITMGQVYTQTLDKKVQNLGMYRLQIFDETHLGVHFQIHKDGKSFYEDYKKAGVKMPVSVAVGGDPLYIWCGQAPLPHGVFELLLYGFLRQKKARLVKCLTNDIFVPEDADFVIEGFIEGERDEGKFGDHTGFYTPVEPFPCMKITQITSKKSPVCNATVVGKPPIEDKFMGFATERIFLPLLRTTTPDLLDYRMPENGVFHNLILAKFKKRYPAHAQQLMHAFWGTGQMSFVKHAVFVGEDAPALDDYEALTRFVLRRFSPRSLLFSSGVCDQLDHASPNSCFGGKLGVDASEDYTPVPPAACEDLLVRLREKAAEILALKTHFCDTPNPITFVSVEKKRTVRQIWDALESEDEFFRILVFFDADARLENLYMCVWRAVNNIDALRDVWVRGACVCVDATSKDSREGYEREWPAMTNCSREVVESLVERGLLKRDEALFERYEIFG